MSLALGIGGDKTALEKPTVSLEVLGAHGAGFGAEGFTFGGHF